MTATLALYTDVHPAAAVFPMLNKAGLDELAADIKANGLLEPIEILDDAVLDGRNRLAACELAGVEPRFRTLDHVESPTRYVLSKNLHRRHLTASQRAMIAAEVLPLLEEEARERQIRLAGSRPNTEQDADLVADLPQGPASPSPRAPLSRDAAGAAVGVSGRSVAKAKEILTKDPEIAEKVKAREVSLDKAVKQVRQQEQPNAPSRSKPKKEEPKEESADPVFERLYRVAEAAYKLNEALPPGEILTAPDESVRVMAGKPETWLAWWKPALERLEQQRSDAGHLFNSMEVNHDTAELRLTYPWADKWQQYCSVKVEVRVYFHPGSPEGVSVDTDTPTGATDAPPFRIHVGPTRAWSSLGASCFICSTMLMGADAPLAEDTTLEVRVDGPDKKPWAKAELCLPCIRGVPASPDALLGQLASPDAEWFGFILPKHRALLDAWSGRVTVDHLSIDVTGIAALEPRDSTAPVKPRKRSARRRPAGVTA